MYAPPRFQPDRAAALAFAETRGFGTICAWNGRKQIAAAVPFGLDYGNDGTPHAVFHLARHNPLLQLADGAAPWVMAVNGADAYVSADWYVSPDQVPTWLYQTVHLTGAVRLLPVSAIGPHLDALTARFESWLAPKRPWTTARMVPGRLAAMKDAIVGLVMAVDEVEGSFRLNQHTSDVDYEAVAAALSAQPDAGSKLLADDMRALRPHLFGDKTTQISVTQIDVMPNLEGTM